MVSISREDTPLDFSPFLEEHAIPLSTATELLEYLAGIGVRLAVDSDRLDVDAPAGAISAELGEELGARKQELVALLSGAPATRACVQGSAPTAPNRPASNDRGPECATLPTTRGQSEAPRPACEPPPARESPRFVPPPALCHECRGAEVGPGGYYCRGCMETYYRAHPDRRPPTALEADPVTTTTVRCAGLRGGTQNRGA
jgi:hypothetical protein